MNRGLLLVAILPLAACNDGDADRRSAPRTASAAQPVRTVLQFLEDEPALEETWRRCRNDPGGIGRTPDCENAGYAKEHLMMLGRERAIASQKR